MRSSVVTAIAFGATMLCGCEGVTPLNSNPPAYIRDVVAYKEGHDGMIVYLVLADAEGRETTADGVLTLNISERTTHYRELMRTEYEINRSQYTRTTVGRGPFARNAVILSLGRIVHSDFRRGPETRGGEVEVFFRPIDATKGPQQVLYGKTTITF